jgi:hypothetical protein
MDPCPSYEEFVTCYKNALKGPCGYPSFFLLEFNVEIDVAYV